jgi:hypothetical protein
MEPAGDTNGHGEAGQEGVHHTMTEAVMELGLRLRWWMQPPTPWRYR